MPFQVIYKPLAQVEASEAFEWYSQAHIGMGAAFVADLGRTNGFVASNPHFYPCVEQEVRRANLSRFPYLLFYVIEGNTVNVLTCFHQHRAPKSRSELLKPQPASIQAAQRPRNLAKQRIHTGQPHRHRSRRGAAP